MKPFAALIAFFALALTFVLPAPLWAKEKPDLMDNEALGNIKMGAPAAAVIKALGQPEKKGEDQKWEATGEWVQDWKYPAQGLKLAMASGKKGGNKIVGSLTASGSC